MVRLTPSISASSSSAGNLPSGIRRSSMAARIASRARTTSERCPIGETGLIPIMGRVLGVALVIMVTLYYL